MNTKRFVYFFHLIALLFLCAPLHAATISSWTASPSSVNGSGSTTLTVTLSAPASTGGQAVTISNTTGGTFSATTSYSTTLTVPAGSSTASEPATITYTSGSGQFIYFASIGGGAPSTASVSVGPPVVTLSSLAISPSTLTSTGTVTLTAYLSASAPSGGASIPLTSSQSGWAGSVGFSSSLVVPAGSNSASETVNITYQPGSGQGPLTLTGTYNSTASASVTVGSASSSGVGTVGGTTNANAPGVSASLTPYSIASGGSSVLRWDTSGATTVTVSGVTQPSATGSVNVSPNSTTSYTVMASNSSGSTYQTVTLNVGGSGSGGDGASTYTPGTTVNNSGSTVNTYTLGGLTIPGSTIPGVTLPGLPTIPPLTIPTVSLPTISLPTLNLPGANAPGDLKIGIPGIGSIGIPSGWLTQLISAAINPASIAQQVATYSAAQFNSLAVYNAGAAVTNAVNNGTATLQQINTTTSENTQNAINATSSATQGVINSTASATQGVINTTATATQQKIGDTEEKSVIDFKGMLGDLLQYLFIPDPSVLSQFEDEKSQFLDWGPYHLITSFQALLSTPAGDGMVGGVPIGIPSIDVNASTGTDIVLNPDGSFTPVHAPQSYYLASSTPIPFDLTQVTSLPGWAFVRLILGAGIWITFYCGVTTVLAPKQVF